MTDRMTPEREAHIRRSAAFDPSRFRLERELLSELDAVRRENAALQEQSEAATQGLEVLRRERDEARQTAQRLNRRAQEAEAALADLRKCVEAINGGKPWCGGSLGRAFLAWDNTRLRDRIAALEARNAALVEAVEAATKLCRCRGTGFYATDCTLCGDSTYDHICNDRRVACTRTECVSARAALARAEAAVKGDKE